MSKAKILILITVLIDVIGIGIIIPILPFYVIRFDPHPIVITSLFAVFALCSFISAPLIGALSDKYGRRPLLIISLLSTSLGWFIFAWGPSLLFLFIGRIIDGLAAGNIPVAQSYLVDLAKDEKERTHNLGLIGAMFGLGLIIGPALGGILGSLSHSFPFWLVGILALINAILAYRFLPESRITQANVVTIKFNPLKPIIHALTDQARRKIYITWFLFSSAVAIFQSVFALFLYSVYGWQELIAGYIYTGVGIILILNQGLALKKIWLKYFSLPQLNTYLLVIFLLGFLVMLIKSPAVFFFGLLLVTLGQSVLRVSLNSTAANSSAHHGEILGIMAALMSLAMGSAPLLAGWLFDYNVHFPFMFNILIIIVAFIVIRLKSSTLEETV